MKDLGTAIKIGRIKKEITQTKLASILGVNKVSIWAWESNKYSPSGEMLIKVAQLLDIVQDIFPESFSGYEKTNQPSPKISIQPLGESLQSEFVKRGEFEARMDSLKRELQGLAKP